MNTNPVNKISANQEKVEQKEKKVKNPYSEIKGDHHLKPIPSKRNPNKKPFKSIGEHLSPRTVVSNPTINTTDDEKSLPFPAVHDGIPKPATEVHKDSGLPNIPREGHRSVDNLNRTPIHNPVADNGEVPVNKNTPVPVNSTPTHFSVQKFNCSECGVRVKLYDKPETNLCRKCNSIVEAKKAAELAKAIKKTLAKNAKKEAAAKAKAEAKAAKAKK